MASSCLLFRWRRGSKAEVASWYLRIFSRAREGCSPWTPAGGGCRSPPLLTSTSYGRGVGPRLSGRRSLPASGGQLMLAQVFGSSRGLEGLLTVDSCQRWRRLPPSLATSTRCGPDRRRRCGAGRQHYVLNCAVVAIVDASTLDLDGSLRVGWVAKAFALLLGWRRRFWVTLKEPVDAPPSLLV